MKTLTYLILTLGSGTLMIEEVIPRITESTIPVFNDAIAWQENTVKTAEYLELSCAKPARLEWEHNKSKAYERIEAFKQLSNHETKGE